MARKAMVVKQQKKQKYSTREYTRCSICGRPHSVIRNFGICRICFRELAYKGQIPGVRKASWYDFFKLKGGFQHDNDRSNCRYAYSYKKCEHC